MTLPQVPTGEGEQFRGLLTDRHREIDTGKMVGLLAAVAHRRADAYQTAVLDRHLPSHAQPLVMGQHDDRAGLSADRVRHQVRQAMCRVKASAHTRRAQPTPAGLGKDGSLRHLIGAVRCLGRRQYCCQVGTSGVDVSPQVHDAREVVVLRRQDDADTVSADVGHARRHFADPLITPEMIHR